jgi:aspartate/methionine/tyrosine aminotransferase
VRFSHRVPNDLRPSRIAVRRERLTTLPVDLTVSNPTRCGFAYPEGLLEALADPRGLTYAPDPRGDAEARRAVAALYGGWGAAVEPEGVLLTASTSEAYGFLFRLLADPGDEVLVPSPSYPLFEHLARLDGVVARPYRLDPDSGWRVDMSSVSSPEGKVRAVVVVHPNNPTGSFLHPDDAASLSQLCQERGWALVADEVFLPYPLEERARAVSLAASATSLTFTLGVSCGRFADEWRGSWPVGRNDWCRGARAAEYVADAYLSVVIW